MYVEFLYNKYYLKILYRATGTKSHGVIFISKWKQFFRNEESVLRVAGEKFKDAYDDMEIKPIKIV